jgi:prolyl oligopeptidase
MRVHSHAGHHRREEPRGRAIRWLVAMPLLVLLADGCGHGSSVPSAQRTIAPSQNITATRPVVAPTGLAVPPPARTGVYADTLHGVAVPDPYRGLEDTLAADTRAFIAAQERYAADIQSRLVGRDSLTTRYERAFRDAPTLDRVPQTPAGLVLTRYLDDAPTLFAAARDGAGERRVVSPADLRAVASSTRIRALVPTHDGRLLALGTAGRGDADAAVAVVEAGTGVVLPDRVPDLLTTTSGTRYQVTWLPRDGAGSDAFFYPRLWPGSSAGAPADRLARGRQFLHRIGTPQSADVAVFGYAVSPSVQFAPEDLATRVLAAPGSQWLVGSVFRSRRNGSEHFVARRAPGDTTVPSWVALLGLDDRAGYPQLRGDTVYALVRRDADRGRIARRVLADGPATSAWETIVPERRGVITTFAVQADALYFTERAGGAVSLYALADRAATPRALTLPVDGTVRIVSSSPALEGVLVTVDSWAAPPRWFRVSRAGATVEALALDDGGQSAVPATLVSARLEARSRDGTLVPVSIVYDRAALRGGRLDGTAPLIVEAYGGFGQATDPSYDPTIQVWTALGGVYAYAHVRGGGELGDAWHEAATREHKSRSVEDVLGAVEALIAHGYTSPGRVTLQGISFGAVIAGLAPLRRADLFGAVVYDVGGPDEVRAAALDPSSARNLAELGDVDTPEGIRLLMAASPYHQVPARLAHPAMLVHSARDDYNFGTEMLVAKHVARLQASNAGTRPVVWVRTHGGHQWLRFVSPEWAAAQTAFLLWQLGDSRYQPSAPRPSGR